MVRRREAEGSIYIGKCQGIKQWPMLPHYNSIGIYKAYIKDANSLKNPALLSLFSKSNELNL